MVMDPGSRLTSRNRLASMLMAQEQGAPPIQSHTQGLASLLRQGLAGFMQGRDERDRSAAYRTMIEGLQAKPWVNPDTGQVAPGQPATGGYAGAMAALGRLGDNEYAAQMLPQLGMAQFQQEEARRAAEAERQNRLEDARKMAQIEQEFRAPPAPATAIQEYNFAKEQGFTGSFQDWKALNRPAGTTIRNESPPPPGYRVVRDANGLPIQYEPIPGSPAAAEAAALEQKGAARQGMKETQAGIVTDDIGNALTAIETSPAAVTGLLGSALAVVPGTPAYDLQQTLMTIGANIGFDKLQAMREASPTGGALGAVSDFENRQLQATYGALAQSQSAEQLARNLRRLHNVYNDIVHGPGNGPPRYNLETGQIESGASSPSPQPSGNAPAPSGFSIQRID